MKNGKWIIRIDSGYIVALPYMTGERREIIQSILDKVADDNTMGLPVVMMAHQAVTGLDPAGHSFDIGTLRTLDPSAMGCGYDYLALGHIHKPQTISPTPDGPTPDPSPVREGRREGRGEGRTGPTPDPSPVREGRGEGGTLTMENGQWRMDNGQWRMDNGEWTMNNGQFRAPVVRYSGSALHVSCDETYPHTVSVVEIDRHGGTVEIRELRIDELRHFYVLPLDGSSFTSADDALEYMNEFIAKGMRGYIRFRFDAGADLPSNFSQMVYDALAPYNEEWRYNPKIIWSEEEGSEKVKEKSEKLVFEVAELQQMTDPMVFIERTQDQYPGLDLEDVRQAFEEVMREAQKAESNS